MASAKKGPIHQASAVPYRICRGEVEFCLITSRKGRWGFPKGIIDPGETPLDTALKEAEEEAGLEGEIEPEPLGTYKYRKWGRPLIVACYLMKVTEAADEWDEDDLRERVWVPADQARAAISRRRIRSLVDTALARLENGHAFSNDR